MIKGLKILFPAALAIVGLAACGSSEGPTEVNMKAGHGYYAPYEVKEATTRAPQLAQTDVNYVGVLLEEDGTIVDLKLDVMQVKVTGVEGATTVSSAVHEETDIKTKWDLLGDYGMASTATKGEWYVQALALEEYAIGKNVDSLIAELKAEAGDFTADVSIHVADFGFALEAALVENNFRTFAVASDEVEDLELGIAMTSSHENSDRNKRSNVNLATAVFSGEEVVAAELDVLQIPYTIDAETDVVGIDTTKAQVDAENALILSKVTIEDAYGMVGNSGIEKEYYEQAQSFEEYLIGKTLAVAFAASSLEDDPTHGSVFADGETIGVTVGIGDYIVAFEEAEDIAGARVVPAA